ncbi:MAG: HEAT repeat domain-containing protein [Leptospirales bacterium]
MLKKNVYITSICFLVFSAALLGVPDVLKTTEEILEPVFRLPVIKKMTHEKVKETIIDEDPVETLLRTYRYDKSEQVPSSVRNELLQAVQKYPEYLLSVLHILPGDEKTHDIVKKLYDSHSPGMAEGDREKIEQWFMLNTKYFREQLIEKARLTFDDDGGGYIENEEYLLRLEEVDLDAAVPILLQKIADKKNPCTATLAKGLLYRRAVIDKNRIKINLYRKALVNIVENRKMDAFSRDLAFEYVMETPWEGQDEWFYSRFADPTFREIEGSYFFRTPLQGPVMKNPDKYIPVLTQMVKSDNLNIRYAAVLCLYQFNLKDTRKDALEPLVPWLSDPDWAQFTFWPTRLRVIQSLERVLIPEAVPGLLKILDEEQDKFNRSAAAEALAFHANVKGAKKAIKILERIIPLEEKHYHKVRLITSYLVLQPYSPEEKLKCIEAYIKIHGSSPDYYKQEELITLKQNLGMRFVLDNFQSFRGASEISFDAEQVGELIFQRAMKLKKDNPVLSKNLLQVIMLWPVHANYRYLLLRLENNEIDTMLVYSLILFHDEVKKRFANELFTIASDKKSDRFDLTRGLAAGLLGGHSTIELLGSTRVDAIMAILAIAGVTREEFPNEVLLKIDISDKGVKKALRFYLKKMDTLQSRKLVKIIFSDEYNIFGKRMDFDPGHNTFGPFTQMENQLSQDVRLKNGPDEVYALLSAGYWGDVGQIVVEIYKEKIVVSFYNDPARKYNAEISTEKIEPLLKYIQSNNADGFKAYTPGIADGIQYEYVHLMKNGGIRVFMNNPPGGHKPKDKYGLLVWYFKKILNDVDLKLSYYYEKEYPGFRVLYDGKKDNFTRFVPYIENGQLYAFGSSWLKFTNSKFVIGSPKRKPEWETMLPNITNGNYTFDRNPQPWKILTPRGFVLTGELKKKYGLWLISRKNKEELIIECNCLEPIAHGNWAMASIADGDWSVPNGMILVDLRNREVSKVNLSSADNFKAIAWLENKKRFLIVQQMDSKDYRDEQSRGPQNPEYYLLNPEDETLEKITGNFKPLEQTTYRFLQKVEGENRYWAAIPQYDTQFSKRQTVIGVYDTESFVFSPYLELPGIVFNSMDMWVDEANKTIYVVYNGHLLKFSL